MPSLRLQEPGQSARTVPLVKRLTSVGRGPDNDVRLADARVPEHALTLTLEGKAVRADAVEAPFSVRGRRRDAHVLRPGEPLQVGETEIGLADPGAEPLPPEGADPLGVLRRLTAFSAKLLEAKELAPLLETLMDEAVALTGADKGFLVLVRDGQREVKVARNVSRENLVDAVERLSDSIVDRVIATGRPLFVADALSDPEFRGSESVVNLKVASVMCVPLMQGEQPFGLVYVGSDRPVNRFDQAGLDLLTIFAAHASLLLQNAMLVDGLRSDVSSLKKRLDLQRYGDLLGSCPGMRDVYRRIDKVAPTDISVLVTGETGTGKELIAREIHRRSPRAAGPFVVLNCGAIPESLLESELFGHLKGAFTGAVVTRAGRFQAASGGTLFLDEVGDMPTALQVKLLRALQEHAVTRVGDTRLEPVDIRVVAATHRVLEEEVKRGAFREDLYYRLHTIVLHLPALRDRADDLLVLARYFLQTFTREYGTKVSGFTPGALAAMRRYAWPGNVRELEHRIQKAVVLAEKPLLGPDDLDLGSDALVPVLPLAQAKEDFQKRYVQEVLDRNGGNRTKAAKELGVDPRTIFRHLERLEAERTGRPFPPSAEDEELEP